MANELSFQMWTDQMQETLDSKKNGDSAFKQKDFRTAIECYSQAASLFALGMETEAQTALKEGTVLEAKKNSAAGHK